VTTPPLCIYCRTPLGPETRRAHVIPQCLGGRLWSTTICCNDCNNTISPLENELCKALREPSAALRARDAENQPIQAQVEADGKTYDYADGLGNLCLPAPEFKEGKLVFPLPGDPDKLADIIAHHLWRNGLTPGALDTGTIGIEPDQTFHIKPHPPERKMLFSRLEVGTAAQMRVVMKMALELPAHLRPDDARRWDVLRPARLYVREGVDDGMLPARFEALSEGAGLFQADEVPRLSHAVEVWTNRQNLHYRVTFFGGLHVTGSLSTRWNGSAFCIGHALDPQKPRRYVTKNADPTGQRSASTIPDSRSRRSTSSRRGSWPGRWRFRTRSRRARGRLRELQTWLRCGPPSRRSSPRFSSVSDNPARQRRRSPSLEQNPAPRLHGGAFAAGYGATNGRAIPIRQKVTTIPHSSR
jgi:HNH endonuclease